MFSAVQHHKHDVMELCLSKGVAAGSVCPTDPYAGKTLLEFAAAHLNARAVLRLLPLTRSYPPNTGSAVAKAAIQYRRLQFHVSEGVTRTQLLRNQLEILQLLHGRFPLDAAASTALLSDSVNHLNDFGGRNDRPPDEVMLESFMRRQQRDCECQHLGWVKFLFALGAQPRGWNFEQFRLDKLCEDEDSPAVSFLKEKRREYDECCRLASAICHSSDIVAFANLVAESHIIDLGLVRDNEGRSLIHLATLNGALEIVKYLATSHNVPLETSDGKPLAELAELVGAHRIASMVRRLQYQYQCKPFSLSYYLAHIELPQWFVGFSSSIFWWDSVLGALVVLLVAIIVQ